MAVPEIILGGGAIRFWLLYPQDMRIAERHKRPPPG